VTGGLEPFKPVALRRPRGALHHHRTTIEAAFQQRPPATVAEAAAQIRGPDRNGAQAHAGAAVFESAGDATAPSWDDPSQGGRRGPRGVSKKLLEPRLADAQAGHRAVFFMDAAHVVFAPFGGVVWCFQRLFAKAPSGRQRRNVLAAINALPHECFTGENLTYITAETVCA
jgi:hypothetical protein